MTEPFWHNIPGHSVDILGLYERMVKQAQDGARFVEVGSWNGRSAAYMGSQIADSGKQIEFWCVDLWERAEFLKTMPEHPYEPAVFETFWKYLEPVHKYVKPILSDSADAAKQFADKSLDFVYIDGDHRYRGVLRDIRAWLPKVKPGGVLAGHDWSSEYCGVVQATEELLGADNLKHEGITWIYEVPSE